MIKLVKLVVCVFELRKCIMPSFMSTDLKSKLETNILNALLQKSWNACDIINHVYQDAEGQSGSLCSLIGATLPSYIIFNIVDMMMI